MVLVIFRDVLAGSKVKVADGSGWDWITTPTVWLPPLLLMVKVVFWSVPVRFGARTEMSIVALPPTATVPAVVENPIKLLLEPGERVQTSGALPLF